MPACDRERERNAQHVVTPLNSCIHKYLACSFPSTGGPTKLFHILLSIPILPLTLNCMIQNHLIASHTTYEYPPAPARPQFIPGLPHASSLQPCPHIQAPKLNTELHSLPVVLLTESSLAYDIVMLAASKPSRCLNRLKKLHLCRDPQVLSLSFNVRTMNTKQKAQKESTVKSQSPQHCHHFNCCC